MGTAAKAAATGAAAAFGAFVGGGIAAVQNYGGKSAQDIEENTIAGTMIGAAIGALVCGAITGAGTVGDPEPPKMMGVGELVEWKVNYGTT